MEGLYKLITQFIVVCRVHCHPRVKMIVVHLDILAPYVRRLLRMNSLEEGAVLQKLNKEWEVACSVPAPLWRTIDIPLPWGGGEHIELSRKGKVWSCFHLNIV
jgi:hypothetical protein